MLENNEGLLERDFATYAPLELGLGLGLGLGLPSPYPQPSLTRYAPFYASFGLSCAKSIDGSSDICYCLKRENNAYFNAAILRGQLELGDTVRYPTPTAHPPPPTTTLTPTATPTPTLHPYPWPYGHPYPYLTSTST